MKKRSPGNQTRYLSQAVQLEEAVNPSIIRSTMLIISITLFVFIGWSAFTNINEVARTPGEVIPQGHVRIVQHLEGGMVKSLHVSEGQMVKKGDILLVLDDAGSADDLQRAVTKQISLEMQEERLRAFTQQREPDFSSYKSAYPGIVQDQDIFFDGMIAARRKEHEIIQEQIIQKKRSIQALQSELQTARNDYAITKDLYDRRAALNQKGYVSDVQFLQTKQAINDVQGRIGQAENRIGVTKAEISEFENRLGSLDAQRLDEAYGRLDQLIAEASQNAELVEKIRNRVNRLEIKAPGAGLVKGITVHTVGAVVQPGQTLMEIVPMDEELIVQVKIPPQHVGHLKPGQKVQVKFSSFDFARYGFVSGSLEKISATTFTGENGERYYQGQIDLEKNYVGDNPHNLVMPGMTAMAEIVTGRKTILDYLLKPIQVSMKTAFTER